MPPHFQRTWRLLLSVVGITSIAMYYRESLVWRLGLSKSLASPRTTAAGSLEPLRFTKDGLFQIAVFEDLHYGEAEDLIWGPQQDLNTTRVMETVLEGEYPQVVVLNGDLITGENTHFHNSTHYIDQIVAPLMQRNLPWASTYGNHDNQYNLSTYSILEREHLYPLSLTQNMVDEPKAGISNYYLPIYPSNPSIKTPSLILWFFDSRGGVEYQALNGSNTIPRHNWVSQSVVDWFLSTNANLTATHNTTIPSLAFYHIPVHAMLAWQNKHLPPLQDSTSNRVEYINDDIPLAAQGQGWGLADGSYAGHEEPFMHAMVETEGLIASFSGHDHGDDWCFKWEGKLNRIEWDGKGLNMCFGRRTGYGGYGTWMRGSRQILVRESRLEEGKGKWEIETWNRLEDGEVMGRVVLNRTV